MIELVIETNPHRGWTSDMINRMMWERIENGTVDPNNMKIEHSRNVEDACEALRKALKEINKE